MVININDSKNFVSFFSPVNPNVNITGVGHLLQGVEVPFVPGSRRTEPDGVNLLNFVHHLEARFQVIQPNDVVLKHRVTVHFLVLAHEPSQRLQKGEFQGHGPS